MACGYRARCRQARPRSRALTAPFPRRASGRAAWTAPPRRFFPDFAMSLTRDATMPRKTGSIEPDQAADIGGRYSARAKLAQAGGLRRFRQLVAGLVEDKAVMMIARLRPDRAAPAASGAPRLHETGRGRAPRRSRLAPRRRRRPQGDSWSAFPCAPESHRPMRRDRRRSCRFRRPVRRRSRSR